MNGGGENNHVFPWETNDGWPYQNLNGNQIGSGVTFEGDKLQDPNRFDTYEPLTAVNEVIEARGLNHDLHIWTARQRTKKIGILFDTLRALIPKIPAKAGKSTIVEKAVNHIQKLQNTFEKLEHEKLKRLQEHNVRCMSSQKFTNAGNNWEKYQGDQGSTHNSSSIASTTHGTNPLMVNNNIPTGFVTWSSPNVIVNVCGENAHISVCCPKKSGLFTFIGYVLGKHQIEILSAQVSCDQFRSMFMIQAHATGGTGIAQVSEASRVEEMYKQVAIEIMSFATPN
nr:transcription factor bHLH95-like [Solanum lycopersicum]